MDVTLEFVNKTGETICFRVTQFVDPVEGILRKVSVELLEEGMVDASVRQGDTVQYLKLKG